MDPQDLRAVGGDLEPMRVLSAYRAGLFPMGLGDDGSEPYGWWSPEERGILPLAGLKVSASLRRSARKFEIRVDTAFAEVVAACADPSREGAWISDRIAGAYLELHGLGWAHSVEAWDDRGELAGGLYGLSIGGLFAGESMFHRRSDASKAALMGLVDILRGAPGPGGAGGRLLDVQWATSHLESLGVVAVGRGEYQRLLADALLLEGPEPFARHESSI